MARAQDRAGTNYYLPFCELLALDFGFDDIYESYGADVPELWMLLRWWLDEKHRGALGLSTIESHSRWTRIGWADSQTLFTSSDRDKLTQFFQWMDYEPGMDVNDGELILYFRRWVTWRDDLNPGTQVMLDDDVFPRELAEILLNAARSWEGVVRDEEGRLTGELVITFEVAPTPRLGLAAQRPRGFPEQLTLHASPGRTVHLQVDDLALPATEQWYAGLELGLTAPMLDSGLSLRAGDFVLRLPPYQLHILQKSKDLGCWASQRLLRPDEPAWLLVRSPLLDRVTNYLQHANVEGWHIIEREGVAPRGWHLIRDVQLHADVRNPPEGLGRLKPRTSNRMGFVGGLALVPGREYLTGGEPDLQLPGDDAVDHASETVDVEVELDGAPRRVHEGLLRLRGELHPGLHEVRLEGVPRKFVTKETLGRVSPLVQQPIRHLIRQSSLECSAVTFGASANSKGGKSVKVAGAVIDGAEITPMPRPIVLPASAASIELVGARPGQILRVVPPAAPPWVEELNKSQPDLWLGYRVFEFHPRFDIVWAKYEYRLGPTTRRHRADIPPDARVTDEPTDIHAWIDFFIDGEPAEDDQEVWHAYLAIARSVAT
jgi:hypothetical protein